jgi:hypothetical protein
VKQTASKLGRESSSAVTRLGRGGLWRPDCDYDAVVEVLHRGGERGEQGAQGVDGESDWEDVRVDIQLSVSQRDASSAVVNRGWDPAVSQGRRSTLADALGGNACGSIGQILLTDPATSIQPAVSGRLPTIWTPLARTMAPQ